MTTLDLRDMYLDLLRSYLTRYGEDELVLIRAESHPRGEACIRHPC